MIKTVLTSYLLGGAKKVGSPTGGRMFFVLLILVIDLFVRALIVNIGYNIVVPKLISTTSSDPNKILSNYRPLTFWESLVLVICVSSLIR